MNYEKRRKFKQRLKDNTPAIMFGCGAMAGAFAGAKIAAKKQEEYDMRAVSVMMTNRADEAFNAVMKERQAMIDILLDKKLEAAGIHTGISMDSSRSLIDRVNEMYGIK